MIKSPQQQIYDAVYLALLKLYPGAVYDYLPSEKAPYPFVVIGEQYEQDQETKTTLMGKTQITLHQWGTYKQRREITDMQLRIKSAVRAIRKTENFSTRIKVLSGRTIPDNSTDSLLYHGILELEIQFI
ncbi:DUF3168 domain-containing protein [Listeria monocytogenes]|nr:DUF3168 domain-containing protein [Listeria monocytogenes]EHG9403439.1 DUF3168 domain-containing protein [Listeria monocytogenes]EIN8847537.1 DUF3168 domain-containing protein [Listeria monocytogenes]EKG2417602.1 DUF3168 domain-containing protein [Listeria monocytogenes]